jgi:hypothetical protein
MCVSSPPQAGAVAHRRRIVSVSLFPNWQTIVAQVVSVLLVPGCYALVRYQAVALPKEQGAVPFELRATPPVEDVPGTQV